MNEVVQDKDEEEPAAAARRMYTMFFGGNQNQFNNFKTRPFMGKGEREGA